MWHKFLVAKNNINNWKSEVIDKNLWNYNKLNLLIVKTINSGVNFKKQSQMGRPSKNTQMDKNKEKIDVSESPTHKNCFCFSSFFYAMCPKWGVRFFSHYLQIQTSKFDEISKFD